MAPPELQDIDDFKSAQLPPGAHMARRPRVRVLGVDYLHLQLADGSDLYITQHGLDSIGQLLPQNHWSDRRWFARHSQRLRGSSACYRVQTKDVEGRREDLVLKWNRMGQDVPGETELTRNSMAQFNSPFQEFSLVQELRDAFGPEGDRIHTKLAIYVPSQTVREWRLGRRGHLMRRIQRKHDEVVLHLDRQYAVIYRWMEGLDAIQAWDAGYINEKEAWALGEDCHRELASHGFQIADHKPHHVIVRPDDNGGLVRNGEGKIAYGMIDFELLERTPEREEATRDETRVLYHVRQARRFADEEPALPPGLSRTNVMGVDYIFGHVESTGGDLWVVGKDPALFDYFLPEKWRKTPHERLTHTGHLFRTTTRDAIHLVWRVSRLGQVPQFADHPEHDAPAQAMGYNSPFEKFSYCRTLATLGIATIYPRAIYRGHRKAEIPAHMRDFRRFDSHASLLTPDGDPILTPFRDYLSLWGYWNGQDEELAEHGQAAMEAIGALQAFKRGLIDEEFHDAIVNAAADRLAAVGYEDVTIRGSHFLVPLRSPEELLFGREETIAQARLCNFELVRPIPGADPPAELP